MNAGPGPRMPIGRRKRRPPRPGIANPGRGVPGRPNDCAKGECVHCHQVNEFRRELLKQEGTWTKEQVWRYPLPENCGLTLNIDQGAT